MIRRWLVIITVLAAVVSIGMWQRAKVARLEAELGQMRIAVATASAERDRAAQARDIAQAHYLRMAKEAEDWAGLTRDLQSMEGRDAPLSAHLRSAAGRVWP